MMTSDFLLEHQKEDKIAWIKITAAKGGRLEQFRTTALKWSSYDPVKVDVSIVTDNVFIFGGKPFDFCRSKPSSSIVYLLSRSTLLVPFLSLNTESMNSHPGTDPQLSTRAADSGYNHHSAD